MSWPWICALGVLFTLNVIASIRVVGNSTMPTAPRTLQLLLVWIVPVIGAVVCLSFVATDTVGNAGSLDRTAFADNAGVGHPLSDASPGASVCGSDGGSG